MFSKPTLSFLRQLSLRSVLPLLALGILLLAIAKGCALERAKASADHYRTLYSLSVQKTDSLKNKYNQTVTAQQVVITERESDVKRLSEEVFNLRRRDEAHVRQIQALVRLGQVTIIDSIPVPYETVVEVPYQGDSLVARSAVVIPPKRFSDSTALYSISGTVLRDGVFIARLVVPDTVSFRLVEVKKGLFSHAQTTVQAIHTSPFVQTRGISSVVVRTKPSAWNRWIKPALVGVAVGVITYKLAK